MLIFNQAAVATFSFEASINPVWVKGKFFQNEKSIIFEENIYLPIIRGCRNNC